MTSSAQIQTDSGSWQPTLYIIAFAQMVTAVGFSSIFPFLPLYVKSLGSAYGINIELLAGLVFSGQAATMMIASPVWGIFADRWGRKLMVERAMFGGAVIMVLMAFVRSAEQLVLLRMLQGMVTGTIGAANALVASVVPRNRTGFAMGMMHVAMGCGVGIGPVIGGVVADAYGYRAAFYVTSALLAIGGVIVYFGVQERFAPRSKGEAHAAGMWAEWWQVLATPGVAMTFGLRFLNQLGRMFFIPILPLFIQGLVDKPESINSLTGLVIGVASAATALCAVFLGRLGDRIGFRRILIFCSLFCMCFFLLQSLVNAPWQLLLLQALAGVSLGGIVPGISALLAGYCRQGTEGAVYGLDNSIVSAARALAPMLGASVAIWMGFRAVFIGTAVLYLAAGILAAWTPTVCIDKGRDVLPPSRNVL